MRAELEKFILKLEDTRRKQGIRYPFNSMMLMILIGVSAGHSGYRPLQRFMAANQAFFESHLNLPHGVPATMGLRRFIQKLKKDDIVKAFNEWAKECNPIQENSWIAADGKSLGSTKKGLHTKEQTVVNMVSFYVPQTGICLNTGDYELKKVAEIATIESMLSIFDNKKVIFTMDALHCQKKL
jgi:hypothetical protein